jgi:hypothetical protein
MRHVLALSRGKMVLCLLDCSPAKGPVGILARAVECARMTFGANNRASTTVNSQVLPLNSESNRY